ncbi:DUF7096 domain-containing protein [Halohasta salina]|uniref:DUF7096 domain-containing protein n=1 Tax=Halohasta salina TaxID=2961621 RepID=UPI0020A6139A|nr:hypothetical protein [Halohasta salina]
MKRLPLVVVALLVAAVLVVGVAAPVTDTAGVAAADGSPTDSVTTDSQPVGTQSATADRRSTYTAQLDGDAAAAPGMTNVLWIPAETIDRSGVDRQHADLGPAAGFDTDTTTNRLVTRTIERELEALDGREREIRLEEELAAVEADVDRLETRERAATREFGTGETTARQYVTELATIHLTADRLRDRAEMLESQATALDSNPISTDRFRAIEYDLRMLEGPVRAHAADILRGATPPDRVLVETGGGAITLAAVDDDQYLREVQRRGLRGETAGEVSADRAIEIIQTEYPILWDRGTSWSSDGPGSVVMVGVEFSGGELRSFIDGPTEQRFIEHQRLPLSMVTTGETTTKQQDGLNVTADQTYAGGPLRLTVTDADTGEPVNATVTVGQNGGESQQVGTTDEAGTLWLLSPRGPFTITVLGGDTDAAFVDVTSPPPEAVASGE